MAKEARGAFSAQEICEMIAACKSAAVSKFSYQGLELNFGELEIPAILENSAPPALPNPDLSRITELPPVPMGIEDELMDLMLTDPVGYEQRVHELTIGEASSNEEN